MDMIVMRDSINRNTIFINLGFIYGYNNNFVTLKRTDAFFKALQNIKFSQFTNFQKKFIFVSFDKAIVSICAGVNFYL